jgi:hypothetical protein
VSLKGSQVEKDLFLTVVHWYVACPSSFYQLEGMLQECGMIVDDEPFSCGILQYTPPLQEADEG